MAFKAICITFIFQIFALASFAAKPYQVINLNKMPGKVEFLATGKPSFLKIKGKDAPLNGIILISSSHISAKLSVPIDKFDTGMSLRNEHMKEKYLHTNKFPRATLRISKFKIPPSILHGESEEQAIKFNGTLILHGVSRPISGQTKFKRLKNALSAESTFEINLTDYAIEIPSFKGITVAETVKIISRFEAPIDIKSVK